MSAAPVVQTVVQAVETRARNLFLLENAERVVQSLGPEQQAAVRRYYDAAMRRAVVADELTDDRSIVSALILYREAVALFLAAIAAAREPNVDLGLLAGARGFAKLDELARSGKVPAVPAHVEQAKQIVLEADSLAFDALSADDLASRRATVESAVKWLRDQVEPRTLREIRTSRIVRVTGTALLLVAVLGWIGFALFAPTNVALHKPVTVSRRHPRTTAPLDNSGLVNGEIEKGYGIQTAPGGAWVMVDLQASYKISKIKVFNRADGWFNEGLPFFLELSDDGSHFTEVDRRTQSFTAVDPWVYDAHGKHARFVRIRSNSYVALDELEVYGHK